MRPCLGKVTFEFLFLSVQLFVEVLKLGIFSCIAGKQLFDGQFWQCIPLVNKLPFSFAHVGRVLVYKLSSKTDCKGSDVCLAVSMEICVTLYRVSGLFVETTYLGGDPENNTFCSKMTTNLTCMFK